MKKYSNPANNYDVIIVGGSYSGLAAAMALGRALRRVLVIDSGEPCNRQTPFSHNFLTRDGYTPGQIAGKARSQVAAYDTVAFADGKVVAGKLTNIGFDIEMENGEMYHAGKLVFATGIRDTMAEFPGFSACWGISVLHCPYCHGYEVRHEVTGLLGNGDSAFEFAALLSNWTNRLTLFTNGESMFSDAQRLKLQARDISIVETEFAALEHNDGYLDAAILKDGSRFPLRVLYARQPFAQHCPVPEMLGCELSEEGYLKVDPTGQTSIPGIYACGDNVSRVRTIANAVATGTTAGIMINKALVEAAF